MANKTYPSRDFAEVASIENVNHRPHPYCITPKHLEYSEMYLDGEAIERAERHGAHCGMYVNPSDETEYTNGRKPGWKACRVPFHEHTSDRLCFVRIKKDCTGEELRDYLKELVPLIEKDVVGFAFIADGGKVLEG